MTIAQIVYDNELSFGYTDEEIHDKVTVQPLFAPHMAKNRFRYSESGRSWTTASGQECPRLRRPFPGDLGCSVEPRCYTKG